MGSGAHARTYDPSQIAGYIGKSETFGEAMAKFAADYANQTEHDYELFLQSTRTGRIIAGRAAA